MIYKFFLYYNYAYYKPKLLKQWKKFTLLSCSLPKFYLSFFKISYQIPFQKSPIIVFGGFDTEVYSMLLQRANNLFFVLNAFDLFEL